ncbi:MAG: hypothetical protein MJ121_02685 [Clostridia bacterium]|nr:hypothetical protein [Clostridia bacterium]
MTKKAISLILAIVLVFSTVFCCAIVTQADYGGDIPVIYIIGQGSPLGIKQEDGTYKAVNYKVDTSAITSKVLANKELFVKAFFTQDWTLVDDLIVEIMTDMMKEIALNDSGEPKDGSEVAWNPTLQYCKNRYKNADKYGLMTFVFYYDWRLDPKENMDELRDYIDMVLEATGKDKYAMCARCEGSNLALEYMYMYPDDTRLTDVIMYASGALGCKPLGEVYAGEMHLDPDAVEMFLYDTDFNLEKDVGPFTITDNTLRQIITIASNVCGLDLALWTVENVYEQVYMDVVPEAMINSYGSFPGYWTMVADKFYEKGKQNVFGSDPKYAKMIEKIDDYHYNVGVHTEEILKNAQANGVEIYNIVKYGKAMAPVVEDYNQQSDMICTVADASWGATSSKLNETFSKEYIKKAEANGTAKYISPDKCIDASTTFLKDTTWFVKNLGHKNFSESVEPLIFAMVNIDGFNIDSLSYYPQYLYYDEETDTIAPLDPQAHITNIDVYNTKVPKSIPRKLKPIFKVLYWFNVFIIKLLTRPAKTGISK